MSVVMTGHNRDDQVETVLFRLFRGTGLTGLTGMKSKRLLGATPDRWLVRPLLCVTRADIIAFMERWCLPFRVDSSNCQQAFSRNFIRHSVLPLVEQRFAGAASRIEQLRILAEEEDLLLTRMTAEVHESIRHNSNKSLETGGMEEWSRLRFLEQPVAVQRRLLAHSLKERDISPAFELTMRLLHICQTGAGSTSLSVRWQFEVETGLIRWRPRSMMQVFPAPAGVEERFSQQLNELGQTVIPQLGICVTISEWLNQASAEAVTMEFPLATENEAWVDLSHVEQPLHIRKRRPGDVIQPFGMKQQVRLKKYLHTHKPVFMLAERVMVIANDTEILWVPGVGISEKLRVVRKPTHRIRLERLVSDNTPLA